MSLNGDLCVICQDTTREALRCPMKAHSFESNIYNTFVSNVTCFKDLNSLPVELKFNIQTTTVDDLVSNGAKWHQSCHLKFSSSKLERAQKRKSVPSHGHDTLLSLKSSKRRKVIGRDQKCLFCDEGDKVGVLHNFTTIEADRNLRQIVNDLQDFELLAKISGGDLIAIKAKYHMKCLTNLRNKHRSFRRKSKSDQFLDVEEEKRFNEARALVEVLENIEDSVENGTLFFTLPKLHSLFENRLSDLGYPNSVNRSRLKSKILDHFQEAHEHDDGKQTVLIFRNRLKNIVKEALQERDFSDDTAVLAKAAKIVRRDMFSHKGFSFSGIFPLGCQESSVPVSLKSLISMIMNGLNVKNQPNKESQACLFAKRCYLMPRNDHPAL